jgi:hypothetical protein
VFLSTTTMRTKQKHFARFSYSNNAAPKKAGSIIAA